MLEKCEAPIFIIGSASTGTTMLSSLLSKHPDIFIGPEMFLFNKQDIYKDYNFLKKNIDTWLKKGLLTRGQINQKIFFLNKDTYDLDNKKITTIFTENKDLKSSIDSMFGDVLKKENKIIWGEKTGSNSYCMQDILKIYPKARIIHMVRDPFDTILSVSKRDTNIFHAASHYLYNNVASLRFNHLGNYLQIKYEKFVSDPDEELKCLLDFLNVKYIDLFNLDSSYWKDEVDASINFHKTWNNSPLEKPNTTSIGKGKKELSKEDLQIIKSMELNDNAKELLKLNINSTYTIKSVSQELGYDVDILTDVSTVSIQKNIMKEYLQSIIRVKEISSVKPIVEQYRG